MAKQLHRKVERERLEFYSVNATAYACLYTLEYVRFLHFRCWYRVPYVLDKALRGLVSERCIFI